MKREIKFPIAAVFSSLASLSGLIRLINYFYQLLVNGIPLPRVFVGTLTQFISLAACIMLTVVLFMRKRGPLLWAPLCIDLVLALLGIFSFVGYDIPNWLLLSYVVPPVLNMINGILYLLFAIFQDKKEASDAAGVFRKIWFIPGILSFVGYLFSIYETYLRVINGYVNILDFLNTFSGPLVSIPMAFLLGWWLTHPYKKEKPIYQMPVAQTYGQPIYQGVGAFGAAQKVICINCGRELLPDETFCANCGTRRQEPPRDGAVDAEQKVFCVGCGRELSLDEDFCGICGTKRPVTKESGHTEQDNHINL